MKNKTLLTICASAFVGLSMGATVAMAYTAAGGGIVNSKHDMTIMAPNTDPYQRVCAYCHTPHHAIQDPNADYLPLWSHQLTTQTNFTAYQSATLKAGIITDPLAGPSRLCMSCHDGAIAIDQHYGNTGTIVKTGNSWGQVAVGTGGDLSGTHPIGFDYAAVAAANRNIKPPTNAFTGNPQGLKIQDTLTNGIMTCSTCHDVHNKDNVSPSNTYNYFIYSPEEKSAICLSCHDK